jgi:hypothetical protein
MALIQMLIDAAVAYFCGVVLADKWAARKARK